MAIPELNTTQATLKPPVCGSVDKEVKPLEDETPEILPFAASSQKLSLFVLLNARIFSFSFALKFASSGNVPSPNAVTVTFSLVELPQESTAQSSYTPLVETYLVASVTSVNNSLPI